jgi:hypothetical protein
VTTIIDIKLRLLSDGLLRVKMSRTNEYDAMKATNNPNLLCKKRLERLGSAID